MTGQRVNGAYVEQIAGDLSDRDCAVIASVGQARVLTGAQLERLHFSTLDRPSRSVVRRRVLARLVSLRVLTTLEPRRIGGARSGSQGLVFALDSAGQQLIRMWHGSQSESGGQRVRRPWTPGLLFLHHTLAVSELYVRLVEASRTHPFDLDTCQVEPACWWPNGLNGWLKPDAYLVLSTTEFRDSYWLEVDRATETIPTVRRKLSAYLDFVNRGQLGPDRNIPRVLVTVPDQRRLDAAEACARGFTNAPDGLFTVVLYERAVAHIIGELFDASEN
jgi:hypothetical protein